MSDGCYWQKDYQDCGMYNRAEAICKVNCNCQGSWSKIYYVNNKGKTKYYWGNVCSGCHGQVEIAGTGRCSGTWHGSTAAGTCKPKKCNSLPVCSAGQVCYDSCTDSTNPAWPSGHSPRATLASTEQRKRPFDATGFTNRTSDLAALSASELYEHRNTSAANAALDDDADLVDVFDIVHVVMHEIIQGEYPQAHAPHPVHHGHVTKEAEEHWRRALGETERALKKMGMTKDTKKSDVTRRRWRRELYPAMLGHLAMLAQERALARGGAKI